MEHYSKGFFLTKPVGNNAFSYEKRKEKQIFVSSFIQWNPINPLEIVEGDHPVFVEMVEGTEQIYKGLKQFVEISMQNKNIYLFDNHNHGFYVIFKEVFTKSIARGLPLIHFDQHKDMRIPDLAFHEVSDIDCKVDDFLKSVYGEIEFHQRIVHRELDKAFYYTNEILNVGNFLQPLLQEDMISEVVMMDSSYQLKKEQNIREEYQDYILDIDLDFFSSDMDYIAYDEKIKVIKKFVDRAKLITICTSPFFVDFERAKKALHDILQ